MRLLPPQWITASFVNHSFALLSFNSVDVGESVSLVPQYAAISVAGCVTAFTVLANALTIVVLLRHRPLQKSISNLYILSLSCADVLIGLVVMLIMSVHLFVYRLHWFFGPAWLCDAWQLSDAILSTISLYSICAVALDRVWNLEKPLRVFKRSRKIAKRLIVTIWALPILLWTPVYFLLTNRRTVSNLTARTYSVGNDVEVLEMDRHSSCYTNWRRGYVVPIVAVPALYFPVVVLVAMFVRISTVVHRHLKFLREHSRQPRIASSNHIGELAPVSSSNSLCKSRESGTPIRTPEISRKLTENSLTTVTSAVRSPRSQSPRVTKPEWSLAPLSEERSSGRERSQSEHFQTAYERAQQIQELSESLDRLRVHGSISLPRRKASKGKEVLVVECNESLVRSRSAKECTSNMVIANGNAASEKCRRRSKSFRASDLCGSPGSNGTCNGSITNGGTPSRKAPRRLSSFGRIGSRRFSVIAIQSNLVELLHREGVSQQVRAAKAVALILSCFLICWVPFLILWPIKVFCNDCVSDELYLMCIWLNYFCSTINPVLYTLSSPRIRAALRAYITQRTSRSRYKASAFRSVTIV